MRAIFHSSRPTNGPAPAACSSSPHPRQTNTSTGLQSQRGPLSGFSNVTDLTRASSAPIEARCRAGLRAPHGSASPRRCPLLTKKGRRDGRPRSVLCCFLGQNRTFALTHSAKRCDCLETNQAEVCEVLKSQYIQLIHTTKSSEHVSA